LNYKILENYTESPLKIYDGCEPNHIFFKLKNEKGKIVSRIDLWNFWEASSGMTIIDNISDLQKINAILNLPVKKNSNFEGDEVIVFDLYKNNRLVPVAFITCKSANGIVISFILDEKPPSRYQCHILAVLASLNVELDDSAE